MKTKRFFAWITAVSICLSAFAAQFPTITANAMDILETDTSAASEGCTILGVYGTYYSQAQEGLDRINAIRREACEAGNVPDPRNPSRTLAPADYVPLKWSADLESIARLRAAEGCLTSIFLPSAHDRLNGKSIFAMQHNGISTIAENLAYNRKNSMVYGIDQWYDEKKDWINQKAGRVTGHYTSMINPKYTYVGLGDFCPAEESCLNTLAAEFSAASGNLAQTMQNVPGKVMQKIEVKNSYIANYSLDGFPAIYTDNTTTLTPRINLTNGSKHLKLWVIDPVTFLSSDNSIATVTSGGAVTGHRNGEAVISVHTNGHAFAYRTITVKCGHPRELLSSAPPACTTEGFKRFRCEVCKDFEQKIPKTGHNYIYGEADSNGYRTGVCSFCQDTLKIIPPTTYSVMWRNSTSDSISYSTIFPDSNPVGSILTCWLSWIDGDEAYRDMAIESSDESVISVPDTVVTDSPDNHLHVLSPGITALTIYPKYHASLRKTLTVRIGEPHSVDITSADVALSQPSYSYTGKPCTPDVSVSYHDTPLKRGTDYTVTYENHTETGTASVLVAGAGIFHGSIRKNFTITGAADPNPDVPDARQLSTCAITLTPASYAYDGTAKTPDILIKDGRKTLANGTDYAVRYENNTRIGTGKAIITGKGSYKGTVTKYFSIAAKKGASYRIGSYQYKIAGASTVSVAGPASRKITKVNIPKTVKIGGKSFKVTAIANYAFQKCTKMTDVTIANNVKTIGTSSFEGCTKLRDVTIGSGVTKISSNAFRNCRKLGTIRLQSAKLKKVGANALKGIQGTAKLKVPAKKLSAYKKLLRNKGQGKKVRITKL